MDTFIVFLRGINVGAKNRIKMNDLREVLEKIGFYNVRTYIQSGNIILEADNNELALRKEISQAIELEFGIAIEVVVRTAGEFKRLLESCPYSETEIENAESANSEGESFYVCFLNEALTKEEIESLNQFKNESDDFRIDGSNIYLLLRHSIRKSKLAEKLQQLAGNSTVRNWKTVEKIVAYLIHQIP
jgi:uncharacterized protein (DUF1697 family)